MNIINQSLKICLTALLCLSVSLSLLAAGDNFLFIVSDTSFSCNDLIHVSVDENCQADISADEIVEGFNGDFTEFTLEAIDPSGLPISLPISEAFLGKTVYLKATHQPSGISCWGSALIEDKWAPQISCSNYQLLCFEDPDDFPMPVATDNCDNPVTVLVIGETINSLDICNGVTITRTFVAVDSAGNTSIPCNQVFTLAPVALPNLPRDTSWSCEVINQYPNVINPTRLTGQLSTTGSGVPDVINNTYCGYSLSHSDVTLNGCGETFAIIRTWTILNWCTNEVITLDADGDNAQQLIKIYDHTPPSIVMAPYSVNANVSGSGPNNCKSQAFLPPANASDNCHQVVQKILTPVGEALYVNGQNGNSGGLIPAPGLGLGDHIITYQAKDECGNVSNLQVTVTVADLTAPATICDELTSVSLGVTGQAEVFAGVLDDGSYDNCCLDSFFVRRMDTSCVASDTLFGPSVVFCCADVGDTVTVVFRAKDCFGNVNDCMVLVLVEEKLPPVLTQCPPAQTIDCGFYTDSLELSLAQGDSTVLEQFGWPVFSDNCEIIYQNISVNVDIDQCQQGTIVRHWKVTDSGGNSTLICNQSINVEHTSDWVVTFPSDVLVNCGETLPDTGEPVIFHENCELIATTFTDQLFTIVPDACFKIVRTWVVINWCVVGDVIAQETPESSENQLLVDLNGDGIKDGRTFQDGLNSVNYNATELLRGAQPDGFIQYQQVIKANDAVAPVVSCDLVTPICVFDATCTVTFSLPFPDVMDCSPELSFSAVGELGTGIGPFLNVPPGNYQMTYQVGDNCGNTGFCQTIVAVKDCKPPTPYCKNGLIVEMGADGQIIIDPTFFDGGSIDNCTNSLRLSFSADINDSLLILTCADLGFISVDLWVTDDAGNQAFCQTFIFVDDNDGNCQGSPLVSGSITSATNLPIAGATLSLSGAMNQQVVTMVDGIFEFEVDFGGDYTVTPNKNSSPLNGVTTFDLVLISKHILGAEPFDSPLKIIAADANQSGAVTTADMVLLRKMILQISTDFPGGNSWRFIDKNFVFPNPLNPFQTAFPEVINLNNVEQEAFNVDFIGVKLGDVNFSADPQM